MPIPGHIVDSSVNHPSFATFMPARAVPGAPVGSTVAIGTVSGLKRKELGGDCNGGGVDGRSSDDGDDGLRDNRGDERGSCFFRSSLRTIVVPKIRSKQRAQAQINQAEKEEERREWKRESRGEEQFFFVPDRSPKQSHFFLPKSRQSSLSLSPSLIIALWLRSTSRRSRSTSCSDTCRNQTLRKVR